LAIAVPLVPAAPAVAATVSVKADALNFKAAGGEANRVRFDVKAKVVTVKDAGARLTAGRGCKSASAHQVVCRTRQSGFDRYNVALRDRDDHATLVQHAGGELGNPVVAGGRGDDVLRAGRLKRYGFFSGGEGDDRITGTRDLDQIKGGAGSDVLIGGKGDDQFVTDPSGAAIDDDEVRGGPGLDMVDYSSRTEPISIDLRRSSPQGSAGEKDVFHSVEGAIGTAGDDTLLGNAAENDMQGIGGRDVIAGYADDDRVWGAGSDKADTAPDTISAGRGRDIVLSEGGGTATGGPGDDEFQGSGALDGGDGDDTFEPTGGQVACGNGDDRVSIHDVTPPVLAACESVDLGAANELSMSLPLERGANEIVARSLSCDQEDGPTPDGDLCANELKVSLGDQLLASGTFDASEETVTLQMPYREGAKEALGADPKQVRVTVGKFSFFSFL
jgi:hypothetical protein